MLKKALLYFFFATLALVLTAAVAAFLIVRLALAPGPDVDIKRRVHLRLLADPDGRAASVHQSDDGLRGALAELLRVEAPLLPRQL